MKCPKCGNNVPDGSVFCNHCGNPLSSDTKCASCGAEIPANSVFCPKCGKMVNNDMAQGESFNERQERLRREAEEAAQVESAKQAQELQRKQEEAEAQAALAEARREAEKARREAEKARREAEEARREAAKQAVKAKEEDKEPQENYNYNSHFNRNLIIGIAIAVAVIALLMVLRNCGGDTDKPKEAEVGTTTSATLIDGQEPLALFNQEMGRSNFMGDGANTAFVVPFPAEGDKKDVIMGVTYQSNAADKSFFKIYRMEKNGSAWHLVHLQTVSLPGRSLTFDNAALIASDGVQPRSVKVSGHDCMFFAYKNFPQSGTFGRVSLALYDLDAKQFTALEYDGPIKTREDGRQYVYGKPLVTGSSAAYEFLKAEAKNIKLIYFPTDEEVKAEQEAKDKEDEVKEEEKPIDDPENADAKWDADNAEKLNNAKDGEDVKMDTKAYDKPIFKMEDKHKSINNNGYTVFSDKTGGVYGFDKATRQYFVIHKGGGSGPTDIGFANSENNELNFTTASGEKYLYNLKTKSLTKR